MKQLLVLAPIFATACAGPGASLLPYSRLNPSDYQSFVVNWQPADAPLCAVITSAAAWAHVLHSAPVMWSNRRFAPDALFWREHTAILLLARVTPAGDPARIFTIDSIRSDNDVMIVDYEFSPRPAASYSIKAWMGAAITARLPATIEFRQGNLLTCQLHPAAGQFVSPPLPQSSQ